VYFSVEINPSELQLVVAGEEATRSASGNFIFCTPGIWNSYLYVGSG